jgi:hypothetical protein
MSPPCIVVVPPLGALVDPPFSDPDLTIPAMDPSLELVWTPPTTGSPPSFCGGEEPRRRGKWLAAALIAPAHIGRAVLR